MEIDGYKEVHIYDMSIIEQDYNSSQWYAESGRSETSLRRKIKILFPDSLITDWVYMHYTTQIWV